MTNYPPPPQYYTPSRSGQRIPIPAALMFRGPSFHFSRPSGEYVKRWGDSGWETVREHLASTSSDLPQRVESV